MNYCKCGCGIEIKEGRKYSKGHQWCDPEYRKIITEENKKTYETKQKINHKRNIIYNSKDYFEWEKILIDSFKNIKNIGDFYFKDWLNELIYLKNLFSRRGYYDFIKSYCNNDRIYFIYFNFLYEFFNLKNFLGMNKQAIEEFWRNLIYDNLENYMNYFWEIESHYSNKVKIFLYDKEKELKIKEEVKKYNDEYKRKKQEEESLFILNKFHYDINSSGIYALYYQNKLIYIGKSINILKRLHQHKLDKFFDSYRILCNCKEEDLEKYERYFISIYMPEDNKQYMVKSMKSLLSLERI